MNDAPCTQFELRFQSFFDSGRGFSFPCDREGRVDLDGLSDRARNNYLFARALVGRELAVPAIRPSAMAQQAAQLRRPGTCTSPSW